MQRNGGAAGGAPQPAAAPTGCFKCGRPGHWSRDCPSSTSTANPVPGTTPLSSLSSSSKFSQQTSTWKPLAAAKTSATAKKAPRTRPKLTPDLLVSDDGLGYVLRHFPRGFKYHGRDHEVSDLGNLIGMYAQWHSHLIPYYSFDQFVRKVEQVGNTSRVRRCMSELRNRVAMGGDPTKLHEPPVEQVAPENEAEVASEGLAADAVDPPLESHDADDIQEQMFDEIYHKATEESNQALERRAVSMSSAECIQVVENNASVPTQIQVTEEQRARMEANRLKALERAAERAAARARSSQTS